MSTGQSTCDPGQTSCAMAESTAPAPFTGACPLERHGAVAFAGAEAIAALQDRLLAEHVAYTAAHSPYYRALFARLGLAPGEIRTVADLALLPCTGKDDLTAHNDAFRAAPPEAIVDVCLTSATTSDRPDHLLQTTDDLARLAWNEAESFRIMGAGPGDTIYIGAAIDRCFMAGLAYFLGGVKLGARMVRGGAAGAAQHWHALKMTGATAIMAVPSLLRRIAEHALECGENPARLGLKRLMAIGEPTRDAGLDLLPAARALERLWGAPLYATYASTELATTFAECNERRGGHLRPELVVLEILDDAGRPAPAGVVGEVVVTPLGVRGMPLLRYRTGDVAAKLDGPCPCGRQTVRLGPIFGRKQQMLKYKGTTVFPSMILAILEGREELHGAFVEARRNPDGTDRILVYCAARGGAPLPADLAAQLTARLRVTPEIRAITPEAFERQVNPEGKRKRTVFFDHRERGRDGEGGGA